MDNTNVIELYNKVRSEMDSMYQNRIPKATQDNIEQIQTAMLGEDNVVVANDFIKTMINKFAKVIVHTKMFKNPLSPLKKGSKPLGDTIEEIYVNFIKVSDTAFDGDKLFKRELPDVKTVYHRMNSERQYAITINRIKLSKAFSSWDKFYAFVNEIINTLYNSAELDEFMIMKKLFKTAYDKNAIKIEKCANPLKGEVEAKSFIKKVKDISSLMKYPSTKYNAYTQAQDKDTEELITFSRYDEQILILPEMVNNSVNLDVLANTFNMSVADFNKTRKILLDDLPVKNCMGALVDKQFLQVFDDYYLVTSFQNAKGLYDNYYLSIGQTLAYSILVNSVLFIAEDDADKDGSVETFKVTKNVVGTAKVSNRLVNVEEGSKYTASVTGEFSSVTVTMGTDITATAYDEETKTITIDSVTDNITITVA